ncbi:hypothetical protein [Nocardia fusca]|uniref:hypothetical protein n=1 Tax=Nocardia fusca TaxID=941183 RepID=UPI0007A74D1D|nr:hypothetical protein [Nocardia fusca]
MWHELAAQAFDAEVYDARYFGDDGDPRWETGDGAAAWIRQCLTMTSASGAVGVLMPAAAAVSRRARPLRRALLRDGTLRALVTGLDERDLWLLMEPNGERPQHLLLIDGGGDPDLVAAVWEMFTDDPLHPVAAPYAVRIVDRLDERIDLTPAGGPDTGAAERYSALRAELLAKPMDPPPPLGPVAELYGMVSLGELAEAGMVEFRQSPPTVLAADGDKPMLTAKDVRLCRPPSRRGTAEVAGAVLIRPGDIAVVRDEAVVQVCTGDGVLLGPGIDLVRTDADVLEPEFLAGVLRAALDEVPGGNIDLHQVGVPRLPPPEQCRYAAAFADLRTLETEWQQRRAEIERVVRLGYRGLAAGLLRPLSPGE